MDKKLILSKGRVVMLTVGEYDDYGIDGFVITVKDIDLAEQAQAYVKETGPRPPYFQPSGFSNWLISKGLVMPIEYEEIFLGSSYFEDEFGVKR